MTLIKSISGIRGTIGGRPASNLTPIDAVQYAAAYGAWLKQTSDNKNLKVVIGRDARISGDMIQALVQQTLVGMGIDVIDLGLSTTPTVEIAVTAEHAQGGIIITASHNPKQWNALKLLNEKGEFLSAADGEEILRLAAEGDFEFAEVDDLGRIFRIEDYIERHIDQILALPIVNVETIKNQNFKIVVDGVNSSGGIAVPALLRKLNVEVVALYCEPTGHFPHNPEPLKEHLGDICAAVIDHRADMGIVVDPDVDRLAFIDERGEMFGEEYTLVACADYVLGKTSGNTVSNLSSSRALRDLTTQYGGKYNASAVGEVNVVKLMKETDAVIGGEGNGGIIYPDLHYGRDALVGIAMFLSLIAEKQITLSHLRAGYPQYFMSKQKIELTEGVDPDTIIHQLSQKFAADNPDLTDGLKIDFETGWVHLRKSNTEPIIRIYSEGGSQEEADEFGKKIIGIIDRISAA